MYTALKDALLEMLIDGKLLEIEQKYVVEATGG